MAESFNTEEIRSSIEKHGPPLSPMLIFTLLDVIDDLQDEIGIMTMHDAAVEYRKVCARLDEVEAMYVKHNASIGCFRDACVCLGCRVAAVARGEAKRD